MRPDEQVIDERSPLKDGKSAQLDWLPIKPGSVKLEVISATAICEDDGKGTLISAGVPVGVINYKTGKVRFHAAMQARSLEASYHFKPDKD
jgi:hypothetical protein